jgi:CheY-like chemotaxis protein
MGKEDAIKKSVVYSAMEVAKICGVVNQTAINWIRNNYLKASTTPGGQFRVYPDDLVEFMEKNDMQVPVEVLENCKVKVHIQKQSVLLVDDDKAWNDVMAKFLKQRYETLHIYQAFDGFEAGSEMASKHPKSVVLDIDLPGIDGMKLCQTINKSDAFGKPLIIVVTALEDADLEKNCRKYGAAEFFKKPVNLPQLADTLGKLLELTAAS